MLVITEFLKNYWKPLAIVLLIATIIWQAPGVVAAWKKTRLIKQQTTIITRRTTAQQADAAAQRESDSINNFINGREYENNHQLDKNSTHANALPPVLLPVSPPHEQ